MAIAIQHPNGASCTCQYDGDADKMHTTLSRYVSGAGHAIWLAAERRAQRRMLLELDEQQLWDIGITREQAHGEAQKPFWK